MTIKDLYNALEKAIDSGEATLDSRVFAMYEGGCLTVVDSIKIDNDGDIILLEE